MTDRNILLDLLHASIWEQPLTVPVNDITAHQWKRVYKLAQIQGVHVLLYNVIQKLPESVKAISCIIPDLIAQTVAAEKNYKVHRKLVDFMASTFSKAKINAVLMKGIEFAAMYPDPAHRLYGDIDWYFPTESDWRRAAQLAMNSGCRLITDSDSDVHYIYGNVVIEHHRQWNQLYSEKRVGMLDSNEKRLFMHYSHLWKHIIGKGVGLRQLCDLSLACKYYRERMDNGKFIEIIRNCHAESWIRLTDCLLYKYMALPLQYTTFPGDCENADTEELLDAVFHDGNLGNEAGFASGLNRRLQLCLKYAPREYGRRVLRLTWGKVINGIKNNKI